jgi:indolepyruvate ferredoxin oxidoreductase beta subunit
VSRGCRILVTGVGGQGVLSVGRWLGQAAETAGFGMSVSELHGLSQRGGAVQSEVAVGEMRSPEIPDGMADILVALEPMEGARALAKVSKRTRALVNTRPLLPSSLQVAGRPYPPLSSLLGAIAEAVGSVVATDATSLAERAGSSRCLNVVMLGILAGSGLLPFPAERILDVIVAAALPAFVEVNRDAFRLGQGVVKEVGAS